MIGRKHKGMVNGQGRSVRREKMVPVAPESQQGKSPGSGSGNRQSGAGSGNMGASDAGSRGGPGTQTGGVSARQRGERMHAQAEADRLGAGEAGTGKDKQR